MNDNMEASVNPNWCDGHPSQCKDSYQIYQDGGEDSNNKLNYYKKYKKYKQKVKKMKNLLK